MDKNIVTKFILDLTAPGTKCEFNNLSRIVGGLSQALDSKKENIYFLSGVDISCRGRAKDKDIISKNYFGIDLDIYNNFLDEGVETDTEGILLDAKIIEQALQESRLFSGYRYIVFSGRGLHIYYTGTPKSFDIKVYQTGISEIFKLFHETLDNYGPYSPDDACKNIGRIMRLPGTINQKNGEEVRILYSQDTDSKIFEMIDMLGETKIAKIEEEKLEEQKARAKKYEEDRKINALISGSKYVDNSQKAELLIQEIDSIPAYLISEKLLPQFQFDTDGGKNFHSDNPANRWTAFYYVLEKNAICNGGSHHFNWGTSASCFMPSLIVKKFFNYSWLETFQWFNQNFGIKIN